MRGSATNTVGVLSFFKHACSLSQIIVSPSMTLRLAPLQLHPVSYAFIKVFQHQCEYKGDKPIVILFFHLFKIKSNLIYASGFGLFFQRQPIRYFEIYSKSMKNVNNHFYLVSLLTENAYANICCLGLNSPFNCLNVFHKYWTQSHYLAGFVSYTYKKEEISLEELYLKKSVGDFL